jgi:Phosphoinositide phospholipase C, Ca2+-dependent
MQILGPIVRGLLVLAGLVGPATAITVDPVLCGQLQRRVERVERQYQNVCRRRNGCSANVIRRFQSVSARYAEQCVAMNQVQVLGSHNSYHIEPRPTLMQALLNLTSAFEEIQYTHPPLAEQFSDQHIRQIELDIYADQSGGLFAVRHGLLYINEDPNAGIPALLQPGFKMVHLPDVDFETTCVTFVECLQHVKAWSDAHPTHLPIAILVEAKEDSLPDIFNLGFITAEPIAEAQFDLLDAEIRSVFPPAQMITPDDVRGGAATLEEAVLASGWPSLADARGKVIFLLDNGGGKRTQYQRGHASLEGLVLFTNSSPGNADAAFVKENDPEGATNQANINALVDAGYLVRTRADAGTIQSRNGSTVQREAALGSGAQFVSTDYPVRDPRFTSYSVAIPGGPARCNPINAPAGCRTIGIVP